MIKLEIEGYCENCLDFNPDVDRAKRLSFSGQQIILDSDVLYTDTIIRCSNRKRCESIKRYLERRVNCDAIAEDDSKGID